MRLVMRFLPALAVAVVAAGCGSDTPTSPSLKQGSAVSAKATRDSLAADSVRLAASKAAPLTGRAAKRAAAVSTVCARQRRSLAALRAELARTPGSRPLKTKERSVSAAVGDACS